MPRKSKPRPPAPQTLRGVAREAMNAHAPAGRAGALSAIRGRVKADAKLTEEAIDLAAGRAFDLEVCAAYRAGR